MAQQDVTGVVTTGGHTAGVRCFHPKAVFYNQVAVSGLAAAFVMPSISVDEFLLSLLFSSCAVVFDSPPLHPLG